MRLAFVGTSAGNAFMNELLAAIAEEVARQGVETVVAVDRFPEGENTVYVVVPHEYFVVVPAEHQPRPDRLRRTVALGVEQPGTPWFELVHAHASRLAAVVDISDLGVRELRRRGVAAHRLQLGYTDYWDRWGRDESLERPCDVMYMGTAQARRLDALAGYATTLWPYETRFLVQPLAPMSRSRPGVFVGDSKFERLLSAKVLLNIHRQPLPYFEWIRVLEALSNGCVLVSEHSEGTTPLVPGEHFLSGGVDSLALLAERLLRDPDRLRELRLAAYDFLRSELTMRAGAQVLVDVAEEVSRGPATVAMDRDPGVGEPPEPAPDIERERPVQDQGVPERAMLKRLVLRDIELSRRIARLEARLDGASPDAVELLAQTPAYADGEPRVSVTVPVYNGAGEVARALRSVAASDFDAVELVVLDDASTDGSAEVVQDFFEAHPDLPGLLLRHVVNRGLPATRNELARRARGELLLVLDADNDLYPPAISRLVAALDENPDAFFAYPILEVHENGAPLLLRSFFAWEPERLRDGNYIDALALLRREQLLELGGYIDDDRLYGWEDYDLWCTCAEAGLDGVLVPQVLARYSVGGSSMLSISDLDWTEAKALLRQRHPRLLS